MQLGKTKKKKSDKKVTPLGKLKTFYNKTSKRPNAYSTWGSKKKTKASKVHPESREKKKESLSEFEKRKDYESVHDPKGKKGWRTALTNMMK